LRLPRLKAKQTKNR